MVENDEGDVVKSESARFVAQRLAPGFLTLALLGFLGGFGAARAQIPGVPGASKTSETSAPARSKTEDAREKPQAAPTKDNPQATVATPSGPINVEKPVHDEALQETLADLLPKYPGVRNASVTVKNGVVTLEGQASEDSVRDDVTQFTRRVQGVRLVLNRMKTDAQVMTASELALNVLRGIGMAIERNWLLVVIAVGIIVIFLGLARLFNASSEMLLAPFVKNVMLRSVVGSLLSSALIVGGFLLGLSVLHLTQAVLSILGLGGIVGLAVGFAFKDIAENFIASLLLGGRRPFQIGDYIQVAGQAGVVSALNTRATVLVTLEGQHIRIPNNIIYKEILTNSSASPSSRGSFDVLIPYEASTATALEVMTRALREQEGVLADPPARALVQDLEATGVRLRTYYWVPGQGVDGFKLDSDVKLRVKVALQQAGITPPPTGVRLSVAGRVPVDVTEVDGQAPPADTVACPVVTAEQAEANLRHDTRAAANASAVPKDGQQTPMEHAIRQATTHVSDEGTNLLKNGSGTHG